MGTDGAANSNRTKADPLDTNDQAVLGKLVWKPNGLQRHTFTVEHSRKKLDADLLSSRIATPSKPNDVVNEFTTSTIERNRLAWDWRFGLHTAWADHVRAIVSVQHAQSHRLGQSFLNSGVHRVRDNRYESRHGNWACKRTRRSATREAGHPALSMGWIGCATASATCTPARPPWPQKFSRSNASLIPMKPARACLCKTKPCWAIGRLRPGCASTTSALMCKTRICTFRRPPNPLRT